MKAGTASSARQERVDELVREMFAVLLAQPVPSRLLSVLDQLDDDPVVEKPLRQAAQRRLAGGR